MLNNFDLTTSMAKLVESTGSDINTLQTYYDFFSQSSIADGSEELFFEHTKRFVNYLQDNKRTLSHDLNIIFKQYSAYSASHAQKKEWLENVDMAFFERSTDAMFEFAKMSLKGIVLANGGALVSMSAFISTIWRDNQNLSVLEGPIRCFALGLVCALIAPALAFFAQEKISSETIRHKNISSYTKRLRWLAIIAFIFSILFFIFGTYGLTSVLPESNTSSHTPRDRA